jgi:hypothetical protein
MSCCTTSSTNPTNPIPHLGFPITLVIISSSYCKPRQSFLTSTYIVATSKPPSPYLVAFRLDLKVRHLTTPCPIQVRHSYCLPASEHSSLRSSVKTAAASLRCLPLHVQGLHCTFRCLRIPLTLFSGSALFDAHSSIFCITVGWITYHLQSIKTILLFRRGAAVCHGARMRPRCSTRPPRRNSQSLNRPQGQNLLSR